MRRDDALALTIADDELADDLLTAYALALGPRPVCPLCGRRHRDSGVGVVTTTPCTGRRRRELDAVAQGRLALPRQAPADAGDQLALG